VRFDPHDLPDDVLEFLRERHLATLTTLRGDGTPHVVPVGFTWDEEARVARVITSGDSQKARNVLTGGRAAICQVDGRRWLTVEGEAEVLVHPEAVREAEQRYAGRYRVPRANPARVVIAVRVDRVTGLPG
jgi:PPOX class probable F420-dependent enzyme